MGKSKTDGKKPPHRVHLFNGMSESGTGIKRLCERRLVVSTMKNTTEEPAKVTCPKCLAKMGKQNLSTGQT